MKMAEIRKLTPDERLDKLLQLRKTLMETRFKRVAGQADKTHEIREMRRVIARIKTLLSASRKAAASEKPDQGS
ncbi:MAG: 50S ribosomal protein L29, partial [Hyphomicrobiales bacterium]|nr:50S ribosomal protein L29 [Hyphomicrobiales bacterium]